MKMADDGFRPAMNVQMATAGSELGGPRAIVAVNVTNVGSDMGAITPMLEQIERRTGKLPETLLADANHADHEAISAAVCRGVNMLVAVAKRSRESGAKGDRTPEIVEWKRRMETDEAKRLYKARAALCEWANDASRTSTRAPGTLRPQSPAAAGRAPRGAPAARPRGGAVEVLRQPFTPQAALRDAWTRPSPRPRPARGSP